MGEVANAPFSFLAEGDPVVSDNFRPVVLGRNDETSAFIDGSVSLLSAADSGAIGKAESVGYAFWELKDFFSLFVQISNPSVLQGAALQQSVAVAGVETALRLLQGEELASAGINHLKSQLSLSVGLCHQCFTFVEISGIVIYRRNAQFSLAVYIAELAALCTYQGPSFPEVVCQYNPVLSLSFQGSPGIPVPVNQQDRGIRFLLCRCRFLAEVADSQKMPGRDRLQRTVCVVQLVPSAAVGRIKPSGNDCRWRGREGS